MQKYQTRTLAYILHTNQMTVDQASNNKTRDHHVTRTRLAKHYQTNIVIQKHFLDKTLEAKATKQSKQIGLYQERSCCTVKETKNEEKTNRRKYFQIHLIKYYCAEYIRNS